MKRNVTNPSILSVGLAAIFVIALNLALLAGAVWVVALIVKAVFA